MEAVRSDYHTTDVHGITRICPDAATMIAVLETLSEADEAEHDDVSLVHESGWCLSVRPRGRVILEHIHRSQEPLRVLTKQSRVQALGYWRMLAEGQLEAVLALPWRKQRSLS